MKQRRITFLVLAALYLATCASFARAQAVASTTAPAEPRAEDGKKLLTAIDLLKINGVGAPRISPDGCARLYTVSEIKTEKDKEWKSVTQIWVVPTAGGKARQYTRGEKNATAPEWSPDGTMIAFLSDREKDGERQVWMMMADGGEAWAVTSHKGGVSGFRFVAGWQASGAHRCRSTIQRRRGSQEGQRRHDRHRSRHQDDAPLAV